MDSAISPRRVWLTEADCRLEDFRRVVERTTDLAAYPRARAVQSNVPVYDGSDIRAAAANEGDRRALMAEWADAMMHGPGILIFKRAFEDAAIIDAATAQFEAMIADQRAGNSNAGDHFAKPGANDRVWNALEKFCVRDPAVFARYYANEAIALVSEAWLGPSYQITSQVNVVNPEIGKAHV